MAKKFNLAEFVQPAAVSESDPMTIREIPLPKIIANGRNLYGVRDVEDLAERIALNGLLEPLIVYPYGTAAGLYKVISGHRRLAALQMNKAETAPCRVVDKPKSAAWEDLMIINANAQRVKTGAEIAAEAERMTAALVALKKEGAEIPGRLRDVVADAMGTSSTALARKRVIQKQLAVPGFKQAWESGKMGETVAYELARMPEKDQYAALDLMIDAGVDYKAADIKTVQKVKRRVEQGESPAQDLAAAAEKLGIECPEGDYTPLLAALVAEAIPTSWQKGLRSCRTRAEGLEHLHRFGFGHHSSYGGGVCYDSDPQALTIRKPIGRRLKWAEVWELLALDAMQRSAVELPAEDERKPAPAGLRGKSPSAADTSSAPAGAPSAPLSVGCADISPRRGESFPQGEGIEPAWKTGAPAREGRYICVADVHGGPREFSDCRWKDGGWWVFDRPSIKGFKVLGWWPLPEKTEENDDQA